MDPLLGLQQDRSDPSQGPLALPPRHVARPRSKTESNRLWFKHGRIGRAAPVEQGASEEPAERTFVREQAPQGETQHDGMMRGQGDHVYFFTTAIMVRIP